MPGYVVFNAMASYEVNEHLDVRFNVDNITDERYAVSSNWNGRRVQLGSPRTYMLTAALRF